MNETSQVAAGGLCFLTGMVSIFDVPLLALPAGAGGVGTLLLALGSLLIGATGTDGRNA